MSFVENFVDLNILKPSGKRFGTPSFQSGQYSLKISLCRIWTVFHKQ